MKEYRNLLEKKYKNKKFLYFYLDKCTNYYYNKYRYGEVAQLARAFGSYPKGHVFESHLRYQFFRLTISESQNTQWLRWS